MSYLGQIYWNVIELYYTRIMRATTAHPFLSILRIQYRSDDVTNEITNRFNCEVRTTYIASSGDEILIAMCFAIVRARTYNSHHHHQHHENPSTSPCVCVCVCCVATNTMHTVNKSDNVILHKIVTFVVAQNPIDVTHCSAMKVCSQFSCCCCYHHHWNSLASLWICNINWMNVCYWPGTAHSDKMPSTIHIIEMQPFIANVFLWTAKWKKRHQLHCPMHQRAIRVLYFNTQHLHRCCMSQSARCLFRIYSSEIVWC